MKPVLARKRRFALLHASCTSSLSDWQRHSSSGRRPAYLLYLIHTTYYLLHTTCYSLLPYCLLPATVERQVVIRGEMQHMRNKVKEANEAAEALAKAVYSTLFDDLVQRINGAVGGERGMSIGVLDIFGFEIFEVNRLERLHSCASNYLL